MVLICSHVCKNYVVGWWVVGGLVGRVGRVGRVGWLVGWIS